MTYSNGDKYEGSWVNGKKHGFGIYIYSDKSKYEGEWANDMRNGKGTYESMEGDRYVGEWVNDKKEGKGNFLKITKKKVFINTQLAINMMGNGAMIKSMGKVF